MGGLPLFLDSILKGGISGLVGGIADIVDRFVTTPDEKAKALIELRALEVRETEIIISSASAAIVAEANSGDSYVRRARPTYLYLIYAVLGFNYIVIPTYQLFTGQPLAPIVLPSDLLVLFGSGYLGYSYLRSNDKKNEK
jgi:hypothetical protein